MLCKFCQSQLKDEELICPSCGRSQEEPLEAAPEAAAQSAPQPEMKAGISTGKLALFVIGCVVLFAVVVGLVMGGMQRDAQNQGETPVPATEATDPIPEETVEYTIPADGNPGDVTAKGSYTVTDDEAAAAGATVVATAGDHQLTNGQLQAYYWAEVMNFAQQYGSYASYFGLDFAYGMDTQPCPLYEDGRTWQQHFLQTALDNWNSYLAMDLEADAAGFQPDEEFLAYMEQLPQSLDNAAATSGAGSTQELIFNVAGKGCTVEDYLAYVELYNKAYLYYNHLCEQIDPTDAEVEAYYDENQSAYEEAGILKAPTMTMAVRHILLEPANGQDSGIGYMTYADEDWAACEKDAQALLDQWKAGEATEDSFAALANEHSIDGGSNTNGGLYDGLTADTNFVEEFKAWYMDESRKPGDTGLVKSVYGYHIMYFSGAEEAELWRDTVRQEMIEEQAAMLIPAAMEKYPMTVDYAVIKLGLVDLLGE